MSNIWVFGSVAALALLGSSLGASAGIKCNGEYQVVGGQEISTPYCQNRHLTKILRSRGIGVSQARLENSRLYKSQMCQLASPEPTLLTACTEFAN
jgi:hypothetical protein